MQLCLLRSTWEVARGGLLQSMLGVCGEAAAAAGKSETQAGVFRDISVSPCMCCAAGCTNMDGASEAGLRLSYCSGCGEARFCSR